MSKLLTCHLAPAEGARQNDGRYFATDEFGWLELRFEKGLPKGRWLFLQYRTDWTDPVVRIVARCETPDGNRDTMLPGPAFGSASGYVFIESDCQRLLLSSSDRPGPFGFEVEHCAVVSETAMIARAFRSDPGRTLTVIGARLIGARLESRQALSWALGGFPLADYDSWRRARLRAHPEPQRSDEPLLCFIVVGTGAQQPEEMKEVARQKSVSCVPLIPAWPSASGSPGNYDRRPVRFDDPAVRILEGLDSDSFVCFVRMGDTPSPWVPSVLLAAARNSPDADVFYGDEDSLDSNGRYVEPRFKPDWSPIRQTYAPYAGRALFFRVRALLALAARCTAGELMDRAVAALPVAAWKVEHIRRVLLTTPLAPSLPSESGKVARPAADVVPKVSVIIPTKDRVDLLRACISGLQQQTTGVRLDIIIVDNGSKEPATRTYYESLGSFTDIRILERPGPFNFSELCNSGAKVSQGETLLFLNNDISMISPDWLILLLQWTQDPSIGAVGPRLLYPTGELQHAGVFIGMGGLAGHPDMGQSKNYGGYLERMRGPHEISCVTGACLAIEKQKFERVGGFDAKNYPVDLNDVEFCLRLRRAGLVNLLIPESVLFHHESASRGQAIAPNKRYAKERTHFARHSTRDIRHDPYFHPALSQFSVTAKLA